MTRPTFENPAERIMVALDVDRLSQAEEIAQDLNGLGVTYKIGNQLGTYEGWEKAINFAHTHGGGIFTDTKFKDIPTTVKKSARAITRHQPDFFNVMADNNLEALEGALEGVKSAVEDFDLEITPKILGVTVLTTLNEKECIEIYGKGVEDKVIEFATQAALAGLDGVVCSAREARMLRNNSDTKDLLLVTPGIRPVWAAKDDQERITTPSDAIEAGADYLVIGRPITQPPSEIGSPREATLRIIEEIS